jgi:hypothetical protein
MTPNWSKIAVVLVSFLIGVGSYLYTKKPDGVVEQMAESILQTQGINVDLSP